MSDDSLHREELTRDYLALRVTREELERAVDNAGPAADAVRRFLGGDVMAATGGSSR